MEHLVLGKLGERYAARYLVKQGCSILERNYRTSVGEIDIIAKQDDALVFTEVKTRSSTQYGSPLEAVDTRKQRQIIRTAYVFLKDRDAMQTPCRFDVLAIYIGLGGRVSEVEWIQSAFDEPGF